MTTTPDPRMIDKAVEFAALSPCRSRRGVVIYSAADGAFRGAGHNGPTTGCPGRSVCAGTCGQRSVHAEIRALRAAEVYRQNGCSPGPYELVHVELATDGDVVACGGPSCPGCAAQILDVGFIGGVWLYELPTVVEANAASVTSADDPRHAGLARWRRYSATEFYEITMRDVRREVSIDSLRPAESNLGRDDVAIPGASESRVLWLRAESVLHRINAEIGSLRTHPLLRSRLGFLLRGGLSGEQSVEESAREWETLRRERDELVELLERRRARVTAIMARARPPAYASST